MLVESQTWATQDEIILWATAVSHYNQHLLALNVEA